VNPGVTFHAPGSARKLREWTPTLPSEFPLWELESQWILESSKGNCKGQNWLDWKAYIIKKLLECRCLKWAHMTHLDISNTSYGQKKGPESNWQFDSRPLKFRNRPDFLAWRWRATYCWKTLDEGYNFVLNLISIGGLHTKLWAPKVVGVPSLGKCHLDVGLVERHKIYYKGEGGGFPQVQAMVNLNFPVAHLSTKSASIMH